MPTCLIHAVYCDLCFPSLPVCKICGTFYLCSVHVLTCSAHLLSERRWNVVHKVVYSKVMVDLKNLCN